MGQKRQRNFTSNDVVEKLYFYYRAGKKTIGQFYRLSHLKHEHKQDRGSELLIMDKLYIEKLRY